MSPTWPFNLNVERFYGKKVGKFYTNGQFGRPKCRWEDIAIIIDLREIDYKHVHWVIFGEAPVGLSRTRR